MSNVTIQKRGKYYQYKFETAKIDGKRKFSSKSGFRTKAEAEKEGIKAYNEYMNTGHDFTPSDMSYSDLLDYWLEKHCYINLKYQMMIEELRTNFLELEGAYSKDSTYWTEVNYKMGGIAGLNLLRTMQKYREKSKNESIYRTLYDNYTSDILCIIEDEILKQCEEYKIANKKYCDFLMENPRIEDFLDNGKIENITPKEVYKIFELMQIINEIDEIRFKEGVRLGIKEGNLS